MFFAAIIVLPILAGLLAGTFSRSKLPAHVLAVVCVALGAVGGITMGGGWFAGRAGMRSIRGAQ
ncbi:MAG TPA: hypothetical protein VD695_08630 [Gaiellaceae bacterium]|nr:hypothetical protein [Gaiellaceae bacterium]